MPLPSLPRSAVFSTEHSFDDWDPALAFTLHGHVASASPFASPFHPLAHAHLSPRTHTRFPSSASAEANRLFNLSNHHLREWTVGFLMRNHANDHRVFDWGPTKRQRHLEGAFEEGGSGKPGLTVV